jgi:hypothetical protein
MLWAAIPEGHDGIVRELDGLAFFSAIETLDLRASRLASLAPLRDLQELVAVHVGITAATSLEPLLACSGLRRVRLDGFEPAAHGAVREALEARGIAVDIVSDAPPEGAPFGDPMLKLAVLEALAGAGAVELPALVAIDAYEIDREHLARLLALPLDDAQLAAVEELHWAGGGMELQHLVWPQYDGESDEFRIHALAGIDALPNLRAVYLDSTVFDPGSEELAALRERGIDVEVS